MNENNNTNIIDLREIIKRLWDKKMVFVKVLPIVFVLACVYILPEPRYYTSNVTLAPEMGSVSGGGSLTSIATSFGIDLGAMQNPDAIYPDLYPNLMESTGFVVSLFDIKVSNLDGDIQTDYFNYLAKHRKRSIWKKPFDWVKKQIRKLTEPKQQATPNSNKKGVDPFFLNKKQHGIVGVIRENITCNVDKKTSVITISVKDQDRLVCASMADSVRVRLQEFITNYRTHKAKIDVEHYSKLTAEAKHTYERARQLYGSFSDANSDVILESYRAKRTDLENDMQLKYNTYTALNTQLQAAKAKLQEVTPAFTVIQCASVPDKPSGPKRMLFVLGMLFFAAIVTTCWLIKDLLGIAPFRKE